MKRTAVFALIGTALLAFGFYLTRIERQPSERSLAQTVTRSSLGDKNVVLMNQWIFETQAEARPSEDAEAAGSAYQREVETKMESAVDKILELAAKPENQDDFAVQYYAAAVEAIKGLKGFVWKMGGFAIHSESIYSWIVGSMHTVRHQQHLYSEVVETLLAYLVLPCSSCKPFETIGEMQAHLKSRVIPDLQKGMARLQTLYTKTEGKRPEFIYDRALVARNVESASEKNRYSVFIRPYLTSTLFYGHTLLGSLQLLVQYDLDRLPDFFNYALYEWAKSKVWSSFKLFSDPRTKVKITTPRDYSAYLAESDFKTLLTRKGGIDASQKALGHFRKAADFDVAFIRELEAYRGLPNADDFILDHESTLANPENKIDRLERIQEFWNSPDGYLVTDSMTGRKYRLRVGQLFAETLKADLKYYYPKEFVEKYPGTDRNLSKSSIKVNDRPTYFYEFGRPVRWNDASFNGFIEIEENGSYRPLRTAEDFRAAHRALLYHDDLNNFASIFFSPYM